MLGCELVGCCAPIHVLLRGGREERSGSVAGVEGLEVGVNTPYVQMRYLSGSCGYCSGPDVGKSSCQRSYGLKSGARHLAPSNARGMSTGP